MLTTIWTPEVRTKRLPKFVMSVLVDEFFYGLRRSYSLVSVIILGRLDRFTLIFDGSFLSLLIRLLLYFLIALSEVSLPLLDKFSILCIFGYFL